MKLSVIVLAWACCVEGRGAGRAFPVESENYVIDAFQRINPRIEWDPSNFLVDLSGNYANCKFIGIGGFVDVDKSTPEGGSIGGYVDDTVGNEAHVDAVNSYVRQVIDKWTRARGPGIYTQVSQAERFGCSVRPGCRGQVSVACLFAPEYRGGVPPPPQKEEPGEQDALAFTEEQYEVAEREVGGKWGRDHFLENLSGYETSCAMLYQKTWAWVYATTQAEKRNMRTVELYGTARNRGETEPAMVEILQNMKKVKSTKVGCSIIPDCMVGEAPEQEMWVVVACVFQV